MAVAGCRKKTFAARMLLSASRASTRRLFNSISTRRSGVRTKGRVGGRQPDSVTGQKAENFRRQLLPGSALSDTECECEWEDDSWAGEHGEVAGVGDTARSAADLIRFSDDENTTFDGPREANP